MIRMFLSSFIFISLMMTGYVHAREFESSIEKVTTVELFTSEGCSSCPLADAWLNALVNDARLWKEFVPMAFHVDYWDKLGWKDPWSSNEFTRRQSRYAESWGVPAVYTPGMVLNGHEWRAWHGSATMVPIPADVERPGVVRVVIDEAGKLTVYFYAQILRMPVSAHVAILGFDQVSEVTAGENSGAKLVHQFNVVEYTQGPMKLVERYFVGEFVIPDLEKYDHPSWALAAWVTLGDNPAPVQIAGRRLGEE